MDKSIELDDALVRETHGGDGRNSRAASRRACSQAVHRGAAQACAYILLDLVGKVRFRDDYDPRAIRLST